mgnify:CR=1 FL=1
MELVVPADPTTVNGEFMFKVGDKVKTHNYYGTNTYGVVMGTRDHDLLVEDDDGRIYLFRKDRTKKVDDNEYYKDRQNDQARRLS